LRTTPSLERPRAETRGQITGDVRHEKERPMLSLCRTIAIGTAIAIAFSGCKRGPDPETEARVAEMNRVAHQRDQLLQEMAENARMMSEISSDLAKVQIPAKELHVSAESPLSSARDSVVQQIRYIAARVNATERKLRANEKRIRDLTMLSDSLRSTLEATIANYDSVIARQRADIATLSSQIAALTDTVTHLNTVYYVAGTQDELIQKGIVVREGGSRFPLLVAKVGQVLVPARELDPTAFTPIDRRSVTEIPLPESGARYRIASRQDIQALAAPPADGKVTGAVKIADPDKFWGGSKFLILVKS
jgi:uncharacterized coiled-coil protein SlyX